jgi:sugar-specific transcriptional regulator TrmB
MYEDDQEEPESVFDQRYSELTEEERDLKQEARAKSRDLDESVYTTDTSYGTTSFEGTRDVKDFYKDAIQGASSTKEKRKLKEERDQIIDEIQKAVEQQLLAEQEKAESDAEARTGDLDTGYEPDSNKSDYESDITQDGVDILQPKGQQEPDSIGGGGSSFGGNTRDIVIVNDDGDAETIRVRLG